MIPKLKLKKKKGDTSSGDTSVSWILFVALWSVGNHERDLDGAPVKHAK